MEIGGLGGIRGEEWMDDGGGNAARGGHERATLVLAGGKWATVSGGEGFSVTFLNGDQRRNEDDSDWLKIAYVIDISFIGNLDGISFFRTAGIPYEETDLYHSVRSSIKTNDYMQSCAYVKRRDTI